MATVSGVKYQSGTVSGGTETGALSWFQSLLTGGKAPTSWYNQTTTLIDPSKKYSLVTTAGGGGTPSLGQLTWQDSTGKTQQLWFTVDQSGNLSAAPSSKNPLDPTWLQNLEIWIAQGGTSVPYVAPAGPSQAGAATSQSLANAAGTISGLGKLLSYLTSSSSWKRIGLGALAVGVLVIALIITLKDQHK